MSETARRPLTAADVIALKSVRDAQITPAGDAVAFEVGETVKIDTKAPKSRIWLVQTDGGSARELTAGPRSDSSPRWSPDGQTLAFFSDRLEDGAPQLFLLPRAGGESRHLATPPGDLGAGRGSDSLQWSPDGTYLALLINEPVSDAEKERVSEKNDAIEFEEHPRFTRLWIVDASSAEARVVTPEGVQIWEFSWAPDGARFVLLTSNSPEEWSWYHARIATIEASGESLTEVYSSRRQLTQPRISPNGQTISFIESVFSDRGGNAGDLLVLPVTGGTARNLTDGARFSVSWTSWDENGATILALAAQNAGTALHRIEVGSADRAEIWSGQFSTAGITIAATGLATPGRLALVREDLTRSRDIWLAPTGVAGSDWRCLTSFADRLSGFELPQIESVNWRAPDGWEIQGFLIKPVGYESGRRYPLVVWVHGGPTSVYSARFFHLDRIALLAGAGIAVLLPNPRGSVSWGRAFAEANVGDMGGNDFLDIMAGVDHVIQRGIADPECLGVGGWSYGGFMTAWTITQTHRFRAAMMGAGIASWRGFHGTSHLADWDAIHYASDPYERDGAFDRFSPIHYVKNVTTPTLIVHGDRDHDVPLSQSHQFYRALKDLGVETRLVIYPREGHGFSEKNHVLDLARRTVEWFVTKLDVTVPIPP